MFPTSLTCFLLTGVVMFKVVPKKDWLLCTNAKKAEKAVNEFSKKLPSKKLTCPNSDVVVRAGNQS